ncbi:carbon-nitrogen hydrolase family protein [Caenispirillum bisanense]|uniref:carbon-nitrogen hydrolase family protein n=1 Tax=Caenispirillum bisanense TaxID=414052 RepID=UPI0031D820F0
MPLRIALYQTEGTPGDIDANIAAAEEAAARARAGGAQLLILPEMYLSGYDIGELAYELAEPAEGPNFKRMAEAARRHGIALLYGHGETDEEGHCYNTATLIDANGRRRLAYAKSHLYGDEERAVFTAGATLGVPVDLHGVMLGVLVCYDVEFPEAVRTLALQGAQLICVPTALMVPNRPVAETLIPARAFENGVFVAYANRCGHETQLVYEGLSTVAAPDGAILVRAGKHEEMIFADIDPAAYDAARRLNPYLTDRRPDLYNGPT